MAGRHGRVFGQTVLGLLGGFPVIGITPREVAAAGESGAGTTAKIQTDTETLTETMENMAAIQGTSGTVGSLGVIMEIVAMIEASDRMEETTGIVGAAPTITIHRPGSIVVTVITRPIVIGNDLGMLLLKDMDTRIIRGVIRGMAVMAIGPERIPGAIQPTGAGIIQ